MPSMVVPIAFLILLVGSSAFAFWKGDQSLRLVAAIVLVGSILSALAQTRAPDPWHYGEIGTLLVDFSMLGAFGAIMFSSNRFWPIWMTAAQLLTVVAHFGPVLRHSHIAIPFAISEQIWSWFILVQLIVATALHHHSLVNSRAP
ncbi:MULTISPECIES: hypothetical protein [unclassified Novosphingobium]|nr:hypothetical protein [Novosphingobium sp. ST904]TCM26162.1 hypothetical protein EDF59_13610 [Novosphingobium sp. ST904]